MIKMIKGGVTAAKGFCAASTAAGIKYQNRQDMAMLYSEVPWSSHKIINSSRIIHAI